MFQTKKDPEYVELHVKEWFIIVANQQEGPYSLWDLKRDKRFTPDTLVWKKGFKEWMPARFVFEIKEVFKDDVEAKPLHDPDSKDPLKSELGQQNQVTLAMRQDPYQFFLWILILLLILFYSFYQFYK